MEDIVAKLLIPDSKVIEQGTKELKEAFQKPEAILALCELIVTCNNPDIRQTAAILLRRNFYKRNYWFKLNTEVKQQIKQGMIQALLNENVKTVKNAIAQFIGIIGKHEFTKNNWPEILQFIDITCNSSNEQDKELGMYVLSIMTEVSVESYNAHLDSFCGLFMNILNSITSLESGLAFYTVITMKNLIRIIVGHAQLREILNRSIPHILEIINAFSKKDNESPKTCQMLDIVEEIIDNGIHLQLKDVRLIVCLCLEITSTTNANEDIQIKCISVLCSLICSKGKVMQKENLIQPIIKVMMSVISRHHKSGGDENSSENDDFNDEDFDDELTPQFVATQTLDVIALNLPSEKVIPLFLGFVEPALQGSDMYELKSAYLTLAVVAEGCSEYIRKHHLESFLRCVYTGINNFNVLVRNAALFALGQFAEHLQPDISKYASEIVPVLLTHLSKIIEQLQPSTTLPKTIDRIFYALETFCENLDNQLEPYLPALMEQLLKILEPEYWSIQLKKLSFSAISSAASAAKEAMLPYFSEILKIINTYISADPLSDNSHVLSDALDCLAVIGLTIGNDHFKPLTRQTLELALNIVDNNFDPENRSSAYAVLGALAVVMKDDLGPHVPKIVEQLINCIQNSEGVEDLVEEDDESDLDMNDGASDSDEDCDRDVSSSSDSEQYKYLANIYLEEKDQACKTLKNICVNVRSFFLPYIEKSFTEVFKLLDIPDEDIICSALEALVEFCICLHQLNNIQGKQVLYTSLQMLIPKCSVIIHSESEKQIVLSTLEAYRRLLDEIKEDILVGEGHREAIMNCVIDVLNLRTTCQEFVDNDPEDEDKSEIDHILLESAGEIIPMFGKAMKPEEFYLYFPNVFLLVGGKNKSKFSVVRSWSIGIIAECMAPLSSYVEKFVPELIKLWFLGMNDVNNTARTNAVFGLGEMAYHGGECVYPYYAQILQAISELAIKETNQLTIDNLCAAIARLILVNPNLLPLEQVFSAFIERLPIKNDFQENKSVVKCFYSLYQQGNPTLKQKLSQVIQILVHIYYNHQSHDDETLKLVEDFLKIINRDFSSEFNNCITPLGPNVTEKLQTLFCKP